MSENATAEPLAAAIDGRRTFALGPVERWVASLVAAALLGTSGLLVRGFSTRMDEQAHALQEQAGKLNTLVTQQAVTNGQLTTLSAQLADIPAITRQLAEMSVRQDEHERRLTNLEERKQ